ncbi:MAG TPA: M48 family metalloprotease, partial [Syntrophorhabdaceae bacterium]|nr:M48 family metalloprotease [Syntrophorhabdaceae bacterium]
FLHENAHIKYDHAAKNALLPDATSAAFTIAGLFLPGVGYGNLIVNPLVTSGYSRSQELEADKDVIDQCHLLRLTPDHYVSALTKLKQYAASKGESSDSTGLFDTHPNLQYRIDAINKVTGR